VKILIAEDSATIRRLVVARLIADGYDVLEAADGEEAVALARRDPPDLLVLDKVMPKADGFAVVRALREDPRTRELPIVMLTEPAGPDDAPGGGLGAVEYLPKPFSLQELSARIRSTLARPGP
jgi:two-component system, OmpR family, alkaline phosphatase synthesis response regulator PhoP